MPRYNRRMNRRRYKTARRRLFELEKKVHQIKMMPEVKYIDTFQNGAVPLLTGLAVLLNGQGQGDNQISRDGAAVRVTSLQLRGRIEMDLAEVSPPILRLIIFWDSFPNGVTFTPAANPLGGTNPALLNTATVTTLVYAPYQQETKYRFQVVYDKLITFNPGSSNGTALNETVKPISRFFKMNRIVRYGDDTALIGSVNKNALYALWITDTALAATIDIGYRVNYVDI